MGEGSRAGRGRHRTHSLAGKGRRRYVQLRLGDAEHAALAEAAGRVGLTVSGYAAEAAVAAARATVPPVPGRAHEARAALLEVMAAREQVRRFGTLVNQAVAALHATGEAPAGLGRAVELTERAVHRLDEATSALTAQLR